MKSYSRLRDFLEDGEENVPPYFAYSASFRIMGDALPFEEIENTLFQMSQSLGRSAAKLSATRLERTQCQTR
jgi:hypothetical protein